MKIVCISDTHNRHKKLNIPNADILIHAGDFSTSNINSIISFNEWLGLLPHKHKIIIAGNNDILFEKDSIRAKELITNAIYLEDSGIQINGFNIWGSPVSPKFSNKAFNRSRGQEIKKHWDMIPKEIDILITHTPPLGILDKTFFGYHAGCKDLLGCINKIKPKISIFGHIHHSYGIEKINEITFVNASMINELNLTRSNPIIIEL